MIAADQIKFSEDGRRAWVARPDELWIAWEERFQGLQLMRCDEAEFINAPLSDARVHYEGPGDISAIEDEWE